MERHRSVSADEIAEAVWPRADASSVGNVRFAIYQLRRRLEPDRPTRGRSEFITSSKRRYALNASRVRVDADEFEQSVGDGVAAFIDGRPSDSAQRLDHALDLYQGEFLSSAPYAAWAMLERSRLYELATKALRVRAELSRKSGDVEGVLHYTARLARMDPCDLDAQRERITVCLDLGRYGEASRHYAELRFWMLQEFGRTAICARGLGPPAAAADADLMS